MKRAAVQIAGLLFGTLVVMIVLHPERFESLWWEKYNDPNGNFSLRFPSKPEVSDQKVQSVTDRAVVMHVVAAIPNNTSWYGIEYYDDPDLPSKTVEEVLNLARDRIISHLHGALLDEQRIQIDGHQARDIQVRNGLASILNIRLIADGQRLVIVTVETAGEKFDSKDIQKFFDTLKLSR